MSKQGKLKIILGFIFSILLILIDYYTKRIVFASIRNTNGVDLLKGIFRLEYVENRGAAFGILQGRLKAVIILTPIIVALVIWVFIKSVNITKMCLFRYISIFFVAGTIGNFIDRVIYGYVVDFFYFELINFPVFNIADIYLTLSTIALLMAILFYYKDEDWSFLRNKYNG